MTRTQNKEKVLWHSLLPRTSTFIMHFDLGGAPTVDLTVVGRNTKMRSFNSLQKSAGRRKIMHSKMSRGNHVIKVKAIKKILTT